MTVLRRSAVSFHLAPLYATHENRVVIKLTVTGDGVLNLYRDL